MPKELVAIAPRQPVLQEYQDPPLQPSEIRVRTEFASPKHGTELELYRADSEASFTRWDPELRLTLPKSKPQIPSGFPMLLGNTGVGVVVEAGPAVSRFKIGDRVYGRLRLRETHTVSESRLERLPQGMTPAAAVCLDPAEQALATVRDADMRLGDRVAVFGLGAIGLFAVQMAVLSGAKVVYALDPIAMRRKVAEGYGAIPIDPTQGDVGLQIKLETNRLGVDIAIEASGSYAALNQAIRCLQYGGLVVCIARYPGKSGGLPIGEWHRNRITIRSTRLNDPARDHPLWDSGRITKTCAEMLSTGQLSAEEIVYPRVPFADIVDAYREIDEHPERSIKLGVNY